MTVSIDNDADALKALMADAKLHAAQWMQRSHQRLPITFLLNGVEGKFMFAPNESAYMKSDDGLWGMAATAQMAFEPNAMVGAVEGWIWVNPKGFEQDVFAPREREVYPQKTLLLIGQTPGSRVEESYRIDRGEKGEFLGLGELNDKMLVQTPSDFDSWFGVKASEEEVQKLLANPALSKQDRKELEMPEEEWRSRMKRSLRHEARCALIHYDNIEKHQKQGICLGL